MNAAAELSVSLSIALFLLLGMSAAGVVHVWWLKWVQRGVLVKPIDLGRTFRGRRIFGDNKRLRGLVAMPLACAVIFALLGGFREDLPHWLSVGMWDLSIARYAVIGAVVGFVFMLAELPNSFLKRQLGVAPGQTPKQSWGRVVCFLLDRFDSVLGVLIVLSFMAPVPVLTWIFLLAVGPIAHAVFSVLLYRVGIKERAL